MTYLPPRKYICENCRTNFTAYGNRPRRFCSRPCAYLGQTTKVTVVCLNCGISFKRHPSAIKWGIIRGQNKIFCKQKCRDEYKVMERSQSWKGGRRQRAPGNDYVQIRNTKHPYNNYGYVYEHRLVMEKHLGRYLTTNEDVHHINGIKNDNRLENLQLMTPSEHQKLHRAKENTRKH